MKITDIVAFVNNKFSLDIASERRGNIDIQARALYYKLSVDNTKTTLKKIGKEVNRTEDTVQHSLIHTWPFALSSNEKIKDAYQEFRFWDVEKQTNLELLSNLNKKYHKTISNSERFIGLISEISDDDRKLEELYERIGNSVKMLKSARYC
jgi:hypothetical protein